MTHSTSLRFSLLDHQVVDADDLPVGRVDDLELELPAGAAAPVVTAVLTGAQALGERLRGVTGTVLSGSAARLRPPSESGPARIPMDLVRTEDPQVRLTVSLSELPHIAGLERWLARHVVAPVPGAGDASE
jgi:hypothetical protein